MSVSLGGAFTRSGGILSALAKQVKLLNFKGVKRISVKFDPFDEKAVPTRDFLFYITSARIAATNPNCAIKTDIICNRESPSITFQLIPSVQEAEKIKTIKIDAANLNALELLKITNEQITSRAPKEDPVSTAKTKSAKKSASGGKRK